jgi:hypothetical protein
MRRRMIGHLKQKTLETLNYTEERT